jgi:pimeloyl-ACP methyl ester carboxylesterase
VSRVAYTADVEMWLERLAPGPVVLVGQSLGGHTAFLTAARRPDLVRGLVVVEATPAADPSAPNIVKRWFESWPVPFPSRSEAREFFGGSNLWARTWADGLEKREGGWWPRFDVDVMIDSLDEASRIDYWADWARVRCPTLNVRAESGISRDEVSRMQALVPSARVVEVAKSQHDVHLEQPRAWRTTLQSFLTDLA